MVHSATLLVIIYLLNGARKSDRAGVAAAYLQKNKMKTKKMVLIAAAASAVVMLTASGIAAKGDWIKVSDSCKKCSITKTEYKCGKCGSGMTPSWKWENDSMKYMLYTFTCNDSKKKGCTHSCQYKCKP